MSDACLTPECSTNVLILREKRKNRHPHPTACYSLCLQPPPGPLNSPRTPGIRVRPQMLMGLSTPVSPLAIVICHTPSATRSECPGRRIPRKGMAKEQYIKPCCCCFLAVGFPSCCGRDIPEHADYYGFVPFASVRPDVRTIERDFITSEPLHTEDSEPRQPRRLRNRRGQVDCFVTLGVRFNALAGAMRNCFVSGCLRPAAALGCSLRWTEQKATTPLRHSAFVKNAGRHRILRTH